MKTINKIEIQGSLYIESRGKLDPEIVTSCFCKIETEELNEIFDEMVEFILDVPRKDMNGYEIHVSSKDVIDFINEGQGQIHVADMKYLYKPIIFYLTIK